MKLLCAFRPCDPGVEARGGAEGQPSLIGWAYLDLSRAVANRLLDCHAWFEKSRRVWPELTNVALDVPDEEQTAVLLFNPCEELADLWTQHRAGETKLARLPDSITADDLPGEGRSYQMGEIDVTVEEKGIWYQIFLPDIQFTVETAVVTRELLQEAAGVPVSSD